MSSWLLVSAFDWPRPPSWWHQGASTNLIGCIIKIPKKSDFSPSKFQLVGDVIGCCRSLVRLSVIFTGIYVSVTFLSPFCHRFHPWVSPFYYSEPSNVNFSYGMHITLILLTQIYILLDFIDFTWILRDWPRAKFIA